PPSWYDPGRFWSGDQLELVPPFALGGEIAVSVPDAAGERPDPAAATTPGAASAPARTARANAAVVSPPRARGADRVSHARPWLRPPALRTPGDGGDEERH